MAKLKYKLKNIALFKIKNEVCDIFLCVILRYYVLFNFIAIF